MVLLIRGRSSRSPDNYFVTYIIGLFTHVLLRFHLNVLAWNELILSTERWREKWQSHENCEHTH